MIEIGILKTLSTFLGDQWVNEYDEGEINDLLNNALFTLYTFFWIIHWGQDRM